jgi:DNA-binding SARP family transcriptional activator
MDQDETVSSLVNKSRDLERSGEVALAIQQAQRAIQLAKSLGDADGEAAANATLAYAHIRLGHYPEARRLCQLALDLAAPDAPARTEALLQLGICDSETDDIDAAEEHYRQAVDLSRQIGDDRALVRGLHDLSAGCYMPRGQFALSLAADEECLKIARRRGMTELFWGPLTTMNYIYWLMGDRRQLQVNLPLLRQAALSGSIAEGYWCFIQASLAADSGDYTAARSLLTQVRSNAEISGLVELNFLYRLGMSQLNRRIGNPSDALTWAEDTFGIAKRIGYRHFQGTALIERGCDAWALNDLSAAEADFRAAIDIMAPLRLNFDIARAALFLAVLLHQQKRPEAPDAWKEAAARITRGGFAFLVDLERTLTLPLLAAYLYDPDPALSNPAQELLDHLERAPLAPLRVTTLGSLSVWVGGRAVEKSALRTRKAGELLGLLLLAPGHCLSFDQALEALWPELEPDLAQQRFHHTTSSLRRALEPELPDKFPSRYLSAREGQISLRLPEGSQVDYEDFEDHCKHKEWEAALAIYQGDFLPDYLYADWATAHRQRCAYLHQQALLAWAEEQYQAGHYSQALDVCRRVLASDAWQEQAVWLGMRACLEMGDRAAARRLYRNLEKTLREELNAEPQAELQVLFRSLEPKQKKRGNL